MFVSGWKIPFSVLNEFNSFLPNGNVHNGYGLTEMAAWVTVDFPKFSENDTVGRLLNGFTVKIIDRDGIRCGIDTDGEICIKDQYEFLGYYKNDELIRETVDFEGFFLTGDIGHFDRNGNLYITDRKKDVIAYEDWVWPFEIENILLQSDDIKAVCAVGVPYNEVIEVPAAVVERNIGSIITEENICQMVRGTYQLTSKPFEVTEFFLESDHGGNEKIFGENVGARVKKGPPANVGEWEVFFFFRYLGPGVYFHP